MLPSSPCRRTLHSTSFAEPAEVAKKQCSYPACVLLRAPSVRTRWWQLWHAIFAAVVQKECSVDTQESSWLTMLGWILACPQTWSTWEDAVLPSASMLLQWPHLPLVMLRLSLKGSTKQHVPLHSLPFPSCLSIPLLLQRKPQVFTFLHETSVTPWWLIIRWPHH